MGYRVLVSGVDLLIDIEYFDKAPVLGKWCDSDWDSDGYIDIEYQVLGGSEFGYVLDSKELESFILKEGPNIQYEVLKMIGEV